MADFGVLLGMHEDAWKERLKAAIKASDTSMRQISLTVGRGQGYLSNLLKSSQNPSFKHLLEICQAVPVSLSYVALGIEHTADEEKLLTLFAQLSPDQKELFLRLASAQVRTDQPADFHTPDTTSDADSG